METIKILVLDHLSLIHAGIRYQLKDEENIEVAAEASTCDEALQFLETNKNLVDILIMDVKFAESCAVDFARDIVENYNHLKIIVFTQEENKDFIIRMIKVGAMGYISKKDPGELIAAINVISNGDKYYSYNISVKIVNLFLDKKTPTNTKLSLREIEVLTYLAIGETNKIVGKKLNISSRTVETHRRSILEKLSVKNTVELIRYALEHKLVA
jgi:two-component system response regulator NreC